MVGLPQVAEAEDDLMAFHLPKVSRTWKLNQQQAQSLVHNLSLAIASSTGCAGIAAIVALMSPPPASVTAGIVAGLCTVNAGYAGLFYEQASYALTRSSHPGLKITVGLKTRWLPPITVGYYKIEPWNN
jgi:hypothetical protein